MAQKVRARRPAATATAIAGNLFFVGDYAFMAADSDTMVMLTS
jgi:hypothetical protein